MDKGEIFKHVFSVDENVYEGFMNVFNDRNALHTDDAYARTKGFTQKVMQGNILNGFISYMIGEVLPEKNVMIHSQTINFKKPVFLNDKLEMELVVKEIHESVNAIELGFSFRNQEQLLVANGKIQIGILK